jgi:hypothetical protein
MNGIQMNGIQRTATNEWHPTDGGQWMAANEWRPMNGG